MGNAIQNSHIVLFFLFYYVNTMGLVKHKGWSGEGFVKRQFWTRLSWLIIQSKKC